MKTHSEGSLPGAQKGEHHLNEDPAIETLEPATISAKDRTRFRDLVVEAGEVVGAALATNIANARALVVVRDAGTIRGVAALKRPQGSYRQKIAKQAQVDLAQSAWPYELGYIYIEPELQGRGLSHRLVAAALKRRDGAGVFATVRADNQRMRATLQKAGFAPAGETYEGLQGGRIGVLLNTYRDDRAG
jgi:RimJ/RimL family protein N-acetyltransferase